MITNLFSIFDPSSSISNSLWIIIIIPSILYINSNINSQLNLTSVLNTTHVYIENEINIIINNNNINGSTPALNSIFIIIIIINLLAIWPFIFTPTAHVSISFSTALILWTSIIAFGWTNYTNSIIIHTVPSGTPVSLINFMVLIELVSNIIRPITLSIRLTANIIAGHLLISLLGDFILSANSSFILAIPSSLILTILELAVAIIQAYVFTTLLTIYFNEI